MTIIERTTRNRLDWKFRRLSVYVSQCVRNNDDFRGFNGVRLNGQIAIRRGNPRAFVRSTSDSIRGRQQRELPIFHGEEGTRYRLPLSPINSQVPSSRCNRRDLINVARSSVMRIGVFIY